MTQYKLQHCAKEPESQKDDILFQMESIVFKMTVVHLISCSFLALSVVEDKDMQSRINEFNVHSFSPL